MEIKGEGRTGGTIGLRRH